MGAYGDLVPDEEAGRLNGSMTAGRDQLAYAAASTEAYLRAAAASLAMRPGASEPDMSAALLKRHSAIATPK